MKKTVVMVCSQYPPTYGGAGKQAQLLSDALASRGWNVSIVTLDQSGAGSGGRGENVKVIRLLKGIAGTNALRRALTTVVLGLGAAFIVLLSRPRAVHVHGAYWWSIPPLLAARLIGATTVVKVTRDGEDDPETVMGRKALGCVPLGWIYGMSFKAADFVVTLSAEAFTKASRSLALPGCVKLIRNGVDVSALERTPARRSRARQQFDVGPDVQVTTFVGYLVEHKGVLDLLAAWKQRETDLDKELWLVGPYDGYYRELTSGVLAQIEDMQASGHKIRLFGHVEAEQMPSIYWATDVFTLPSYAEGMPNSLAEAIVAGCAIVATAIPGITDIVDSNQACLVQPGDVTALSSALDLARVNTAAFELAANTLGIERTAGLIEDLYVTSR